MSPKSLLRHPDASQIRRYGEWSTLELMMDEQADPSKVEDWSLFRKDLLRLLEKEEPMRSELLFVVSELPVSIPKDLVQKLAAFNASEVVWCRRTKEYGSLAHDR